VNRVSRDGRVLDLQIIINKIQEKLGEIDGRPTLRPINLTRRNQVTLKAINKMLSDVEFDINLLYELIKDDFTKLMARYNDISVSYKSQRSQINLINGIAEDLLFSTRNAEDNFYGIFDSFHSKEKVDVTRSTDGIIDVEEGVAALPFSMASAIRQDLSHLYNKSSGNISQKSNAGLRASGRNIAKSKFGDAFSDIDNVWNYEVTTEDRSGVEVSVQFPINKDESTSVITRVELSGIAGSGTLVDLRTSLDDQNYTRVQNGEPKSIKSTTEKIAWDFPNKMVKYIKLIMTKDSPDGKVRSGAGTKTTSNPIVKDDKPKTSENSANDILGITDATNETWRYVFTIGSIGVYKMGRKQNAVLYSEPLKTIDAPLSPISKVSLNVEEEIAPNTAIDYAIGLSDVNGNMNGDFIDITPENRVSGIDPKIISMSEDSIDNYSFSVGTGDVSTGIVSRNAINFYPIYNLPTNEEFRFGTSKLFRGKDFFSQKKNKSEEIINVSDNYIDFSDAIRVKELYSIYTENASVLKPHCKCR
jgi:hypothetical protein